MSISTLLGQIVAVGGGAAVIAFFIFRFLGKSWIENKFAQSLDRHRHDQALEIQRLRVQIDSMLSGTLKIQEQEFEVLPEARAKLHAAYGSVASLVYPGQEHSDLNGKTPDQLEEFLAVSKLRETEKEEIRQSENKVTTYTELNYWHRLLAVKNAVASFHNYVTANAIFFPPALKMKFIEASNELTEALIDHEIGTQENDRKFRRDSWKAVENKVKPLLRSIEAEVYSRLQGHGKGDSARQTPSEQE